MSIALCLKTVRNTCGNTECKRTLCYTFFFTLYDLRINSVRVDYKKPKKVQYMYLDQIDRYMTVYCAPKIKQSEP